jgi:hypothetical protein
MRSEYKIISGGQTGADRAALDFAIEKHIPYGGWIPRGRIEEDGRLDSRYTHMAETSTANPAQRTAMNVNDSGATIIFTMDARLSGGSALTAKVARTARKPLLHITPATLQPGRVVADFILANDVHVLNIAGTRQSKAPIIYSFVRHVLEDAFGQLAM